MTTLFSVVIPTYNRADLVLETLQTVFDQTYQNYEVIVVDNCSTDNTEELLKPLSAAGKIKYFRNDKNYERARSRNVGMQKASGDFLTFLDSDDFMYPDALMDAAVFVKENPDIQIFQNMFETVNDHRDTVYVHEFPPLDNQYLALANGNFISCIGGFISKEIYHEIKFAEDPRLIASEDYEIWFNILARYKMGRINKINSGIREHPNRSVNNGAYAQLEYQRLYIIDKIAKDTVLNDKFGKYLNRISASFILQQIVSSYQTKSMVALLGLVKKAVATDSSITKELRFYKVLYNIFKQCKKLF